MTGTVQEYIPSGAAGGSLSTTELSSVTNITTVGTHALPAPILIGTDGVQIPTSDIAAANAVYESLEGMLVTVDSPLVVGPTNNFGEIFTVASDGAGATGLNDRGDLLISGGDASFGNTDTAGGDFNPERIQIDPGLGVSLPNVNTGAHLSDVTGVVGYDFGNYQVMAKTAPTVTQASSLTKTGGTLTGDDTHLLVASYNTENLDPSDGPARFATVANEIVNDLNSPDIIALQEIQDNSGATDNGVTSASTTLQMIVDAINAAGGPQYAYIDNPYIGNDTNGGEPGGNIRTSFIYRTDRVTFVPGSLATIDANGNPITSGTYTDQQTNPDNPYYDSRPPISATFTFNGQNVTVLSNHFTSKGGSDALYGSNQPPFNAGEVQRAAQAQAVNNYVDGLLAANPNANVIVAGDLNEFGFEQPINVLQGTATITNYNLPGTDPIDATATYTPGGTQILNDLEDTLPADQRYDYIYEGNAEALDHILVTDSLAADAQFQPVHINSEFHDQTSDHDPLLASFVIACYGLGTLIETAEGDVAVESLAIGDLVRTMSGALRPIKWIGTRSYAGRFIAMNRDVLPVCFKAGSLGENALGETMPRRDLLISPHHAMYIDSLLIEAKDLVNGVSILQAQSVERVDYFHIELDSHDVIVAEGAFSETFIDDDSRAMFHNAMDYAALYPGEAPVEPLYCAPRVDEGFELEAVREKLLARAAKMIAYLAA